MNRVNRAVQDSIQRIYEATPVNCTIVFTEPKPAHEDVMRKLFRKKSIGEGNSNNENIPNAGNNDNTIINTEKNSNNDTVSPAPSEDISLDSIEKLCIH